MKNLRKKLKEAFFVFFKEYFKEHIEARVQYLLMVTQKEQPEIPPYTRQELRFKKLTTSFDLHDEEARLRGYPADHVYEIRLRNARLDLSKQVLEHVHMNDKAVEESNPSFNKRRFEIYIYVATNK